MEEKELACLVCEWSGPKKDAKWHDLSGFDDDSMCSNQKGSGWWECPKCEAPCVESGE